MSVHDFFSGVEPVLLVVGMAMVMVAYLGYVRRTRDLAGMIKFWEKRLTLTRREYAWQRIGIVTLLLGVVVRYLLVLGAI